jgi:hypothetical protein
MRVDVTWSHIATAQLRALSHAQQQSVQNTVQAIRMSPRVAHYSHQARHADGSARAVWVAYGLLVKVQFTIADNGARVLVQILGVAPTDLPGIADYEERP